MYRHLLALVVLCTALSAQVSYWSAYLDGAHASPAVATPAQGWAVLRHDASTNTVRAYCCILGTGGPVTSVTVQQGAAGINGAVVLTLAATDPTTWTGTGSLTSAQVTALGSQGLYLNARTAAFPSGEVRGQIVEAQNTRLASALSGTQVAPPTISSASGLATAFLFEPENRLAYVIETTGVVNATVADLHLGSVGSNGPLLDAAIGVGNTWCGVTEHLSDADVAALRSGRCYVDVHSARFPAGELRGQLRTDFGAQFLASCSGAQETPPNASTALCSAELVVGPDDRVTLTGAYSGLTPIAAHVHTGSAGIAGPILFSLNAQTGRLSGSYSASPADLLNLRAGFWYVNVHYNAFTGGEIRGQLSPAPLPTTYGQGCRSSTGGLPLATTQDAASLGSPLKFTLYDANCCNLALLAIGQDRDTDLAIGLPTLGFAAPNCHALTHVLVSNLGPTDPFGCSTMTLSVPFDQALRGTTLNSQWLLIDPAANAIGLVVSNATTFTIQ